MKDILNFTEAALNYIKSKIIQEQAKGFRLSIRKTGCSGYSYAPSIIREELAGDIHFKTDNEINVYLDGAYLDQLQGLTVDFIEEKKEGSLKQKRLVFMNPNEKSRCGCGESFHV